MANMRKSILHIISGIILLATTATACGSGAETEKQPADTSTTVKPADTPPASPADTTHMDSANTKPVKGTN